MKNQEVDKLYDKIKKLEKERMDYLEVNDKNGARRIKKRIEDLELKIEMFKFNKLKQELNTYKEIVRKYPTVKLEIDKILSNQK